jgi:ElaB/YqjD/DUF883 family membrane-anchored ribosome-binding protein
MPSNAELQADITRLQAECNAELERTRRERNGRIRALRNQAALELRNDELENEIGELTSVVKTFLEATEAEANPDELDEARKFAESVLESNSGPAWEPADDEELQDA